MKINSLVICLGLFFTISINAKVRDLYVNDSEMPMINLKMGKSTVLRFGEKPKKVVIGNQNYFNVEFIDNDVTIQPLGIVTTNVFIYGEYQTYGLILDANNQPNYDDLVVIRRGFQPRVEIKDKVAPGPPIDFKIEEKLGEFLKISSKSLFFHEQLKLYVMDLTFENLTISEISIKGIQINLSRSKVNFKEQQLIFENQSIAGKKAVTCRVFFKDELKKSFTLEVKYKGKVMSKIIEEKYL